jgi:hypothetical protein
VPSLLPFWPTKVAFAITTGQSGDGKGLVPILMYMIFVAVGVFLASVLGHSLSASEKERFTGPMNRRCQKAYEVHRRRAIRRQRVRCRLEG